MWAEVQRTTAKQKLYREQHQLVVPHGDSLHRSAKLPPPPKTT